MERFAKTLASEELDITLDWIPSSSEMRGSAPLSSAFPWWGRLQESLSVAQQLRESAPTSFVHADVADILWKRQSDAAATRDAGIPYLGPAPRPLPYAQRCQI